MKMSEINWQNCIDNYIAAQRKEHKFADNEFRASSLNGCLRQTVRNRLELNPPDVETLRHFQVGTLLHSFIEREVSQGYINHPVEFEKQIVLESDGVKLTGHIDCTDGKTVWDIKSSANAEVSAKYPNLGYQMQLSVYCHALEPNALHAILVYIDKRNLQVFEKKVDILPLDNIVNFCLKVMEDCKAYKETGVLTSPNCGCWLCKREVEGK